MPEKMNLTGKRFGRLVVLEEVGVEKGNKLRWLCKCDCGVERAARGSHLKCGNIKSCGCLRDELSSERAKGRIGNKNPMYGKDFSGENNPNYRHGIARTKFYANMMEQKRNVKKRNQTVKLTEIEKDKVKFVYEVASMLVDFEVDHIQPISKGGSDHPNNLQLLHRDLNMEKHNKYPLSDIEKKKYRGFRI